MRHPCDECGTLVMEGAASVRALHRPLHGQCGTCGTWGHLSVNAAYLDGIALRQDSYPLVFKQSRKLSAKDAAYFVRLVTCVPGTM